MHSKTARDVGGLDSLMDLHGAVHHFEMKPLLGRGLLVIDINYVCEKFSLSCIGHVLMIRIECVDMFGMCRYVFG